MAAQFKKGAKVTVVSMYAAHRSGRAVYTYRHCTVTSWGKKRATLRDDATGEHIKAAVYTSGPVRSILPREVGPAGYLAEAQRQASEEAARLRRVVQAWAVNQSRGWEELNRQRMAAVAAYESGDFDFRAR